MVWLFVSFGVLALWLGGGKALAEPSGGHQDRPPFSGSWVCVSEKAAFQPRDTAEDLVYKGKMWLSNGYYGDNSVLYHDLWSSTDGAAWTLVNDKTPYDGYSEMVVYKDKMWAIKGSVWSSTDGVIWTQVSAKTPFGARGYGETVVYKGKIWQLGSGEDVWSSGDGANWTCAAEHAPYGKRYGSAVAVYKGKIWLMGGAIAQTGNPPEKHYPGFTTYNDVWCSTDGKNWTQVLEHAPWDRRMWFVSKIYANRMWIIGGFDNVHSKNFSDAWYTEDGKSWHQLASRTLFSPRHEPTCYVYDNSLWVVAGNSWPLMNDVWRLTLPEARKK